MIRASTRVRMVKASTEDEIYAVIEALKFKVELKHLLEYKDGSGFLQTFTIPDDAEFNSIDLRGL